MTARCIKPKNFEEVVGLYIGYELNDRELVITLSIPARHLKIALPQDSVDSNVIQTELNRIEIGEKIGILFLGDHRTKLRRLHSHSLEKRKDVAKETQTRLERSEDEGGFNYEGWKS